MHRRQFIQLSLLSGAALAGTSLRFPAVPLPAFLPAYDTETDACMRNLSVITDVHRKHHMPATFFVVADKLTAKTKPILTKLLDDPLFEVASHTTSHTVILDHPICGAAGNPRREIVDSKKAIEDAFGKAIIGFRPACGHANAFRGQLPILSLVAEAGYRYTSSLLWGPDHSLPADLVDPFNYRADGYGTLWEIPGHGWHENLLKNNNQSGPLKVTMWPSKWHTAIPKDFIKTPEEEFAINKIFLDAARQEQKRHVTFIWHPWSLLAFDKEMKMLDLTFGYAKEMGLPTATFRDLYKQL
jgi:peptidoglycan/xylan/chitin deacetylase (PgdA/CDA1 family)